MNENSLSNEVEGLTIAYRDHSINKHVYTNEE